MTATLDMATVYKHERDQARAEIRRLRAQIEQNSHAEREAIAALEAECQRLRDAADYWQEQARVLQLANKSLKRGAE